MLKNTTRFYSVLATLCYVLTTVECRTLLGEPEWVHVQNMEQLHDCYQNVTEHKPQATVYEKSTDNTYRTWVRLASLAGMSCCMVVAGLSCCMVAARDVSTLYTEVALSLSFMTCDSPHWCHHWRGRSMWWVTPTLSGNANNGIDRWNLFAMR